MAVTKKTVGAVLQSGLPATTYVEDFETRRVLESIKTALRLLGNILDGKTDDVATDIAPDVQIEAGQGIKVQNRGGNRFKISSDGSEIGTSGDNARSLIQSGVDTLIELTDVALSGLAAGDALKYSYSLKWINEANRTPFAFVQTGLKAGYFVSGKLRLNGTEITPSGITFGTGGIATITATHHYMTVTISTGATAWGSGSSFPADTDTTSTIPVAIFTFTGGGDILTYTPVLSDHFVQYGTVPNGTATGQMLKWDESTHKWTIDTGGYVSLATCRLGYSISGTTLTLRAGKLRFLGGGPSITIASANFTLAGTQYAYVTHTPGSGTAAWAVAGAEPGVSNVYDIVFYKFVDGAISEIHRAGGDIDLATPLA